MNSIVENDPQKFLEVALEAVKKAEPIFRASFGKAIGVQVKDEAGYHSPVSDVDREIETLLIAHLTKHFPDHSISGEEFPAQKKSGAYTWHIDPIDGTMNYIRGLPTCSISLGLWERETPLVGVVYDPIQKTLFSAIRGKGAFKNKNEKLSVSTVSGLSDAVGMVSRAKTQADDEALERVARKMYRTREFGGSALEVCYIAEGKLDIYISERVKVYDVAASALVLSEAGGRFTDWEGNRFTATSRKIVATNGNIHEEVLNRMKG